MKLSLKSYLTRDGFSMPDKAALKHLQRTTVDLPKLLANLSLFHVNYQWSRTPASTLVQLWMKDSIARLLYPKLVTS